MAWRSFCRDKAGEFVVPGSDGRELVLDTTTEIELFDADAALGVSLRFGAPLHDEILVFHSSSSPFAKARGVSYFGEDTPQLARDKGGGGGGGGKNSGGGSSGASAPTDITLTNSVIVADAAVGSLVGLLGAVDADRKESFSFSLLDNDGGSFAIDGDQLLVTASAVFDTTSGSFHNITVQVSDKYGLTYDEVMTITVEPVDSGTGGLAPTDIALSDNQVATGDGSGTVVGVLSATDPDNDGPYSWQLVDDAGGVFAVSGDQLIVADGMSIDLVAGGSYALVVEVADQAGNLYSETMTIEVVDRLMIPVPDYVLEAMLPAGAGDTTQRWNADGPLGDPVTVSYSFLQAVPDYYAATAPERKDFIPFTLEQQAAARDALALIEQFTDITFVETTETIGDIAFGTADLTQGSGWAYLPGPSLLAGDVWLDNAVASNQDMAPGKDGFQTLLHEIGHALGMKHPHEGATLPADELNRKFTVMAYSEHPDMAGGEPTGYQLYDVAALQHLYGANSTATAGDDVYDLSNVDGLMAAIWDAGGWDVLDASGTAGPVVLDLSQASFSSAGTVHGWYPATDNVAIAYGTVIEEARGGSSADVIIGNAADNVLSGGAGADTFAFAQGWGTDIVIDFEDGIDRLDFSAVAAGFGDLAISDARGVAVISLGDDALTLAGVSASAVDESDFIFSAIA